MELVVIFIDASEFVSVILVELKLLYNIVWLPSTPIQNILFS